MRRSKFIVIATVFSIASLAAACSLQEGGEQVLVSDNLDGSGSPDSHLDGTTIDGTTPDGSTPTGDSSTPDSATPDGSIKVDAGPTFLCGTTPVANCAADCPAMPHDCPSSGSCIGSCYPGCAGFQFQCDACGTDGGVVALSRCEPEDASAYAECLVGLNRCACPGNIASQCPGTNQTCESKECFECAEPDGGPAQIGHQCAKPGPNNTCESNGACN